MSGAFFALMLLFANGAEVTEVLDDLTPFESYPEKFAPLIDKIPEPNYEQAVLAAENDLKKRNRILHYMEKGRIYQIRGEFQKSLTALDEALELIKKDEGRALISMKRVGAVAASVGVNDTFMPYTGYGFEKVLIHHYQAINYLATAQSEAAGVEIRRANARQGEELEKHHQKVEKAEEKKRKTLEKAEKKQQKALEKARKKEEKKKNGGKSWRRPFGKKGKAEKESSAPDEELQGEPSEDEAAAEEEAVDQEKPAKRGGFKNRFNNIRQKVFKKNNKDKDEQKKKIDWRALEQSITQKFDEEYAQMDEIAGQVKNSFQNAYTFYFSGLIYEQQRKDDDAYIDFRKGLEIKPQNPYLLDDTFRLASDLKRDDDLDWLKKKYPDWKEKSAPGQTKLIVFFEEGRAPIKEQLKISVPIDANLTEWVSMAAPIYPSQKRAPKTLSVHQNGLLGETDLLCDVQALAVMSLKEQAKLRIARQITRMIVKGYATKIAQDEAGATGGLAGSVYGVLSENADLRSWLTLPSNIQVGRFSIPEGSQRIVLKQSGLGINEAIEITPESGQMVLLQVIHYNNNLYINPIYI